MPSRRARELADHLRLGVTVNLAGKSPAGGLALTSFQRLICILTPFMWLLLVVQHAAKAFASGDDLRFFFFRHYL